MATEALTVQSFTRGGAELNYQSVTAADGFTFPNDGKTGLLIENDAGALTLTFTMQKLLDGQANTRAVVVAASEKWGSGTWPTDIYNDTDDLVTVTPSADLANGIAVISYL